MRHIFWDHTEAKGQGEVFGPKSGGGDRSKKGGEARREREQKALVTPLQPIALERSLWPTLSQDQCIMDRACSLAKSLSQS